MTFNLDINTLVGPGRRSVPVEANVTRDLRAEDFEQLAVTDRGVVATELQRVTDRHHALARLIAGGMSNGEAAIVVGYSASRVSILLQSKAFAELLELYRRDIDREHASVHEHMAGLSKDALLELRQRIEEEPDKFSHRELLAIVGELHDRSDNGETLAKLPVEIELIPQPIPDRAEASDET